MNDVEAQCMVGIGSAVVAYYLAVMRQTQQKNKELADAVLVQNNKHNDLEVRVSILEAKGRK